MTISRKGFLKALGFGILASQAPLSLAAAEKVEKSGAGKLRIKDVEIYAFDVPLVEPFRVSLGVITAANDVLVRIITDSGLVGLGEASPYAPITGDTQDTDLMMARSIREMIKGKNPLAVDALITEIGHIVHSSPSIVAAFDMALMDIVGKAAGLPLFRLLGGDKGTFESDVTVGIDAPEKMAASAAGHVAKGYKNIKLKVGLDPDLDAERVRAVREAIGKGIHLKVDANQGWTVPQAILALRKMDGLDVEFAEQPVVAWDSCRHEDRPEREPHPHLRRRVALLPPGRPQADQGGRLRLFQHQADEGRRDDEFRADRPHRRRGQYPLHGRLYDGNPPRPHSGRPCRGLAAEHRIRRPRRLHDTHRGPGRRRDDRQVRPARSPFRSFRVSGSISIRRS